MRRLAVAVSAATLFLPFAAAGQSASAAPDVPAQPKAAHSSAIARSPLHGQVPVTGFFRGHHVRYLDLGPVALAKRADGSYISDVDPLWHVTNGTPRQHNIIDNIPGLNTPDDYTPLWRVVLVTWTPGRTPHLLRSAKEVAHEAAEGDVRLVTTDTVVNCPVLGHHQSVTKGFIRDRGVKYFDFGPIALATKAGGGYVSDVDPLWHFTNGTARQRNIIDNVPGLNKPDDYTPLWLVSLVTWKPGAAPRTLRDAEDVMDAVTDGTVTITQTSTVVNCPVL